MAIDLSNIKTQIKSIFDEANTTTAAYDLSTNLATRVNRVMKINPQVIPYQSNLLPAVTVHTEGKSIEHSSIAKNQLTAKRRAELFFEITGIVWVDVIPSIDVDPADEEIEKLMENVEEVIRRSDTLNSTVEWTSVSDISYHTGGPASEQSHLRVGILSLKSLIFY